MLIKIKETAKEKIIAYNGRALPLGQRSDYGELAIIALESGDTSLLEVFETLPTLEELKKQKVEQSLPELQELSKTSFNAKK